MHNGLETRPLAPLDLLFINGQREFRPAPEQSLQCAYALKARKLMAKTKMNSGAERKMPVRLAREIKFFRLGIRLRIEVGCRQYRDRAERISTQIFGLSLTVVFVGMLLLNAISY